MNKSERKAYLILKKEYKIQIKRKRKKLTRKEMRGLPDLEIMKSSPTGMSPCGKFIEIKKLSFTATYNNHKYSAIHLMGSQLSKIIDVGNLLLMVFDTSLENYEFYQIKHIPKTQIKNFFDKL